jgi:acyl-coenzyme A synthetase/AMP-(fatty) acid ligase
MNLVKRIIFRARDNELDPAIAFSSGVATFRMLTQATAASVQVLQTLELSPGSIVMLDIHNPLHHMAMLLALALLGLPSASVGTAFVVEKAGVLPSLFLTDRDDLSLPGVTMLRIDDRWFVTDPAAPVDYAGLLALPGFASPDDVVRYVYSSGTTGFPKCVALTEPCLELRVMSNSLMLAEAQGAGAALNMMGFSTIAGIMAPLIALPAGVMLCFASNYVEALHMIRLFNINVLAVAVIQLQGILKLVGGQAAPRSLRLVVAGGSKMPLRLLAEARAKLCSNVTLGYGSTEMGSMTSGSAAALERFEGSAGYLLPGVEMQAVDQDGREVSAGSDGIIRARSREAAYYVSDGGDRIEMFKDAWFYPGDVGRIYPDGLVVITGRTNEVINRGGIIVAPEVIEEVLRLDSRVQDIAVVGVLNAAGIEEIWAAVVSDAELDARTMIEASRPKLNEKVPDRIIRIDAIPRNENGKIKRNELRELLRSAKD